MDTERRDDFTLHDATLETLSLDWATGRVEVVLRSASGIVILRASGVTHLVCPRLHPWGRSSSVNGVRGPRAKEGGFIVEIEMQSGDVIVILAGGFAIERT